MPPRIRKIRHDDETRAKIQAAQIINRLHGCIMGTVELSASQVSAAKTLLSKVLPDLQATEISGEVAHNYVALMPGTAKTADEWHKNHAPTTLQ
jgi:hypothetical protein